MSKLEWILFADDYDCVGNDCDWHFFCYCVFVLKTELLSAVKIIFQAITAVVSCYNTKHVLH